MPRHLISDAHEWINEIPTVPVYYPAKPQPRERAWRNQRGKKTLLSLTLAGRSPCFWTQGRPRSVDPGGRHCQVGSLAGAAHLLKDNADELNENRNLVWNKRVKARLILISSTNTNRESVAYRSFSPSEFEARGVRKVTTGITGLIHQVLDCSPTNRERELGLDRRETESGLEAMRVPVARLPTSSRGPRPPAEARAVGDSPRVDDLSGRLEALYNGRRIRPSHLKHFPELARTTQEGYIPHLAWATRRAGAKSVFLKPKVETKSLTMCVVCGIASGHAPWRASMVPCVWVMECGGWVLCAWGVVPRA
ncbi:hypothetical protein Lal_00048019 [Lupinus albus]|nr:hypothetical protein Lal_00048019 [Lupinus albus]